MGMSAIRANCVVHYEPLGVAASVLIGVGVSTLALWFTFRDRGRLETIGGAVALGLAIATMHYSAMIGTSFTPAGDIALLPGPALTQPNLAFIVAIVTFLICGLFLVLALPDQKLAAHEPEEPDELVSEAEELLPSPPAKSPRHPVRIPVRRNQSVHFAEPDAIMAVRADGHYSWISLKSEGGAIEEVFCERSISGLAKVLAAPQFARAHRSHLVNIAHVQSFRRQGDGGLLLLKGQAEVSVPVSRSNLRQVLSLLECHPELASALPHAAHA
jgi:hypothetical protein